MFSSRLITVLKTFSEQEIKALNSFLEASIVSGRVGKAKCLALFKAIFKFHPTFEDADLEKEKIFKKIYKSNYEGGKLEKLMSDLMGLIQDFILQQNADIKKSLPPLRILYDFYTKKKLFKLASVARKKLEKKIKQEEGGTVVLREKFLLEKSILNNQLLFYNTKNPNDFSSVNIALDHFYLFEKLELACQLLATNQFLYPIEIKDQLKIIEQLQPLFEQEYFDLPLIKVYYKAFTFLNSSKDDMESNFLSFEKSLAENSKQIPDAQLVALLTLVRNYCVVQYHKGVPGYLEKSFNTYKDHLDKGLLYVESKIFGSTMMNVVVFGLKLKAFDWVYQFITTHKGKIIGVSYPEETYKLNLANYYFYVTKYEKALDLLSYNFEDIYYKLRAKRMEIKIYFETNHTLLYPRIDAFKVFIYRLPKNKVSVKHKKGNRDFVDILKQIINPKTYKNKSRIDKLKTKINTSGFINEKNWLLEKLDTLY